MNQKREILGLIPRRGGSKGLENKNIRPLLGKPLIGYTIEAAKECSDITRVVVTTDDNAIERIARDFGAEVYRHPPLLSVDGNPTFPVIQHVVGELLGAGSTFDLVATMRATSPLRRSEDISQAIELLYRTNADSVVSVVADPTGHPIRLKFVDENMRLIALHPGEENSPIIRQNLPLVYRRNGAIYITKTSVV